MGLKEMSIKQLICFLTIVSLKKDKQLDYLHKRNSISILYGFFRKKKKRSHCNTVVV